MTIIMKITVKHDADDDEKKEDEVVMFNRLKI